jgi:intein/homing endonuclease
MTYRQQQHINIPQKCEELAEFFGILTGDGFMNKYPGHNYVIEIAGDSRHDKTYQLEYASPLIHSLFKISPKVYYKKGQHTMYLRMQSKELYHFLSENGFPSGRKNQIGIPQWISENEEYMTYFVRGLFDTDGSLCLFNRPSKYNTYYPAIQIGLKSEYIIDRLYAWFVRRNFTSNKVRYEKFDKRTKQTSIIYILRISGRNQLEKWMREIGFNNYRHVSKYEKYKKMGRA